MFFEFNYKYHLCILYKKDLDLYLKSKTRKDFFFKL